MKKETKEDIRFSTGCTLLDRVMGGAKNVDGFPAGKFINIVGDSSSGKAQPLYSKILTPNGWVFMENIKNGDEVCTVDGKTAMVTGVYPQGLLDVYTIQLDDMSSTNCADNHLWSVLIRDLTTGEKQYSTVSLDTLQNYVTNPKYAVYLPPCKPFKFYPDRSEPLLVDPYLAGAFFATKEEFVFPLSMADKLDDILKLYGQTVARMADCCTISIPDVHARFYEELSQMGLIDRGENVEIPAYYMFGTIEERLKLLQGILDTLHPFKTKYNTFKLQLDDFAKVHSICDLIRSLGGVAKNYMEEDKADNEYKLFLEFSFYAANMPDKSLYYFDKVMLRKIHSVVHKEKELCQCIMVDCPDHLYITDDYIPTHNTFLANEIIAANYYKMGKKFRWIYDDCESGYSFSTDELYGFDIPSGNYDSDYKPSTTVEECFVNISNFADSLKKNECGIYVIDSLDGLTSDEQDEIADDRIKAINAGKTYDKGSYKVGKQKYLSGEFFPQLAKKIEDKSITVIIISQVRGNLEPMSFEKFRRSGGKALDFYCYEVLWLATLKKRVKKERAIGVTVKAKLTKGKVPRPFRECVFTLLYDYGLDNLGSNIDFLYDLLTPGGELSTKAKSISYGDAKPATKTELKAFLKEKDRLNDFKTSEYTEYIDFILNSDLKDEYSKKWGEAMSRGELMEYIENNSKENEIVEKVLQKWEEVEDSLRSQRKKRYATIPESED